MLSQKEAKKLGRPNVIDLRKINAQEYLESKKTFFQKMKALAFKYLGIFGIIWFVIISFVGWGIITPFQADASDKITYERVLENSSVTPPFTIYSQLKDECYAQDVKDKWHCIKTGLSIAYAECTWKDYKTPFGLQSNDKSYKKWVKSYNKYWYKATDGFFFYGDKGELGKSRYCTSEESSGSDVGCPNGKNNFNSVFNSLGI